MPSATLLHHTPLWVADKAIGKCWDKPTPDETISVAGKYESAIPGCNIDRIERVANKNKHASTIEHISYNFELEISRACLQELARHRISSFSVKSSRYTLKELKKELPFHKKSLERASNYIVITNNYEVDTCSVMALESLRMLVSKKNISNDIAKYCMPESYKTSLIWTVNARSLQNFLALRSSKAALWEIRELAKAIFDALPEDHKFLFEACIAKGEPEC
jgi:thymidylate synthase (FAD)